MWTQLRVAGFRVEHWRLSIMDEENTTIGFIDNGGDEVKILVIIYPYGLGCAFTRSTLSRSRWTFRRFRKSG